MRLLGYCYGVSYFALFRNIFEVVEVAYSGFEIQTAIALASKFNSHLAKLSESELEVGEGSFGYDYSFLDEYELGKVLSLASYELGFTYQFAYSKKEPGRLFYERNNSESPDLTDSHIMLLSIILASLIMLAIYLTGKVFSC